MPAPRKAAAVAAVGLTPLALTALAAAPASAHGSMGDPVSRVSQCFAEGPENPRSAACKAAVAAGGTQALYDWNGVRIGDVGGRHQEVIPDGELCSAGNDAFKGLDLARADWPATSVSSGSYTFKYRVTAQHKGTFKVYLTKEGYDPAQPLTWDDLDLSSPVATATDPVASNGFYTFSGTLPERSGKHLLYAVWQRSDSPEAFYSCSDVSFGGDSATGGSNSGSTSSDDAAAAPAPSASAPTDEQIEDGNALSTVEHHGHGDDDPETTTDPTTATGADEDQDEAETAETAEAASDTGSGSGTANDARPAGAAENLAETGGDSMTPYVAVGGAAVLALGSSILFASTRRRAAAAGRHGR
ncbi:lytic polysaccharide monooxygenase [Streptomyces poonensis]|uniref:Chitin-binding protein n=1 Tax=Streptomyces poonensis TaxID=68255 RepID=A0A918PG20_9ACTN|nr:lytic polysaccharide monooxygenase [Streptomyces poonensis]GGZ06717.1 chitin-binding protein [Streptomyces poonensis]GLJ88664.1 chitin-binding protein [Streptomyces poonensis]